MWWQWQQWPQWPVVVAAVEVAEVAECDGDSSHSTWLPSVPLRHCQVLNVSITIITTNHLRVILMITLLCIWALWQIHRISLQVCHPTHFCAHCNMVAISIRDVVCVPRWLVQPRPQSIPSLILRFLHFSPGIFFSIMPQ